MMYFVSLVLLAFPLQAAECPVAPLEVGVTQESSLSSSDCRAQDVLPGSAFTSVPDLAGLTTRVHSIKVPEPDGVLTIAVSSTSFPPFVVVVSDKSEILGLETGSATTAATLLISLKAGTYTVLSGSRNTSVGTYSIQGSIEARRDCVGAEYKLGDPVNGTLEAPDCRILDVVVPGVSQRRADVYRIALGEYTIAGFQMGSNSFLPVLMLVNAKSGAVIIDGSNTNNNSLIAELFVSMPEGEYLLLATSSSVAAGQYAMRSVFERGRTCSEETITLPTSIRSGLANADCRLLDYVPFNSNFSFVRPYKFELTERAQVTIDQLSTQFDSYLNLLRANKTFLAEDDDGGGNGNSRIVMLLNPGTYTILANSYEEGATGAFELRTGVSPPPGCPVVDVNPGDTISGSLTAGDCRIRDMLVEQPSPFVARQYRITLPETSTLSLELNASGFGAGLALFDVDARSLELNAQQTQATTVRGQARLIPGTYTVLVYSSDFRLGSFTLGTNLQP